MRRNPPHRAPVAAREEQLRLAMLEPGILAGGQKVEQLALQRRHPGGVAAVEAEGELDELALVRLGLRSEEHTSALQSLMRISYAVFCLKTKNTKTHTNV